MGPFAGGNQSLKAGFESLRPHPTFSSLSRLFVCNQDTNSWLSVPGPMASPWLPTLFLQNPKPNILFLTEVAFVHYSVSILELCYNPYNSMKPEASSVPDLEHISV